MYSKRLYTAHFERYWNSDFIQNKGIMNLFFSMKRYFYVFNQWRNGFEKLKYSKNERLNVPKISKDNRIIKKELIAWRNSEAYIAIV